MAPKDTYTALIEPFDEVHKDTRGGVTFDYATGEQVATRLNEVLTVAGWSFKVLEHGIHVEADEIWVLGEITATFDGAIVTRQQFGSQKIKRSRKDSTPLDIGFDLKGATTDAMKKCASLVGVGLYLSHKESRARADAPLPKDAAPMQQGVQNGNVSNDAPLKCEECGEGLKETQFRDGTVWSPAQLQGFGKRKYSRTLCMTHYREANDARKRAEAAPIEADF